ncbi:MAG: phosphatidylglycerophosphatase A [Alphaproteobacteria bacterium]|nr:phosphatidylglycerophosphatase A [Alphaproteobacteria bacterium]
MKKAPAGPPLNTAWALLATWFGAGRLPFAPGTWGSLAALPFAAVLLWLAGPWALAAGAAVFFFVGLWAALRYVKATGRVDPADVVIDEVVGQWIALILVPYSLEGVLLSVVFFRAFDILKPWPIRWIEQRWPGPLGVMLDDVVAGLAALACMAVVRWIGG